MSRKAACVVTVLTIVLLLCSLALYWSAVDEAARVRLQLVLNGHPLAKTRLLSGPISMSGHNMASSEVLSGELPIAYVDTAGAVHFGANDDDAVARMVREIGFAFVGATAVGGGALLTGAVGLATLRLRRKRNRTGDTQP